MSTGGQPQGQARAMDDSLQAVASGHPFLAGLAKEHLDVLMRNAMPVRFEQGETIFTEGDPANRFYLIQTGKISLETHGSNGPVLEVETLGAGDVLGWSWLFPPYRWQFTARATAPASATFFYGTRLREQCEQDHELGYELLKRLAAIVTSRLQATRKQLLACHRHCKELDRKLSDSDQESSGAA